MEREHLDETLSREQRADILQEQLTAVARRLREAQKLLRRDWEQLTPRARSEGSRQVKELEQQQQALLDEFAMYRLG